MRREGEEIRRRLPRIVTNLIMAIIFWLLSTFVPPTLRTIVVPGVDIEVSVLVFVLMIIITGIFLVRALSDALVLGDILTDVLFRKMGIKEERSPKRAAREFAYIIVTVLLVTALVPILSAVEGYGFYLTTAATYLGLGLIIIFIYDIGRIFYGIVEKKADSLAEQLVKRRQKGKGED